jgi:hypothetical protein
MKNNEKYTKPAAPGMGVESYEIILNGDNIITDSINGGTSNFADFNESILITGITHGIKDVLPYYFLGNDPLDFITTNIVQRIKGDRLYRDKIPQYMPSLFGIKK